jgi:hypothetical protein
MARSMTPTPRMIEREWVELMWMKTHKERIL